MKKATCCLTLLALWTLPAAAQEAHKVGLDFAVAGTSSQTLGATWHVTRVLALRPTFSYSHSSNDSVQTLFAPDGDVGITTTTTSEGFGAGVEALAFLTRSDSLSTYVAAGYRRVHSSNRESAPELATPGNRVPPSLAREVSSYLASGSFNSSANSNVYTGAFGLQYEVSKRVSVFAQSGVSYSAATSERTVSSGQSSDRTLSPSHTKTVGTLSASLGVLFYLN